MTVQPAEYNTACGQLDGSAGCLIAMCATVLGITSCVLVQTVQQKDQGTHSKTIAAQADKQMTAFQVCDDLKQQLQSLSNKHASLLAQQHASGFAGLAADSGLARLRSQLAESRAQAAANADKLTAALETCRCPLTNWTFL